MNCKCNKLYIGIIIGLILPVVMTFVVFNYRYYGTLDYFGFLNQLLEINAFTKLLSVCVVPNLLVFFIAIWKERLLAARGIVTATFVYVIIVLLFKFVI